MSLKKEGNLKEMEQFIMWMWKWRGKAQRDVTAKHR
ncbi:hypothetical protein VULLAG_LOCUS16679 [Vulpes lagopus]